RVGSTPAGATLVVDGEPWDQPTPTVLEVSAGEPHHLVFRLEDYQEISADVEAVAGQTTDVDVVLEPELGRLVVRSSPPVAGEVVGETPLTLEDVARERVEVAVALEGHGRHREWAPFDETSVVEIDANLTPRRAFGTLDVSSTPWARVKVDGRLVAESTPATGIRLPVGRHAVLLENPRLNLRARRSVRIREGAPTRLVVQLR
ncbi:MAG: PEGA domain-containing protein, partial [Actinobacteria bacterium]|nr:PEGA domain-containing protein [Actinomycetota bacterium]NIU70653.1 PEGA domain-containing protein [Actinomycetota bacterium]NIW32556.1 PEGA domain-containing protein [Actinomycetota bacterium]